MLLNDLFKRFENVGGLIDSTEDAMDFGDFGILEGIAIGSVEFFAEADDDDADVAAEVAFDFSFENALNKDFFFSDEED